MKHHPKPAVDPYYPRWITLPDGNRLIVPNHQMHSALMGKEYDEKGELVHPEIVEPVIDTFGDGDSKPSEPVQPIVIPEPAPDAKPDKKKKNLKPADDPLAGIFG